MTDAAQISKFLEDEKITFQKTEDKSIWMIKYALEEREQLVLLLAAPRVTDLWVFAPVAVDIPKLEEIPQAVLAALFRADSDAGAVTKIVYSEAGGEARAFVVSSSIPAGFTPSVLRHYLDGAARLAMKATQILKDGLPRKQT